METQTVSAEVNNSTGTQGGGILDHIKVAEPSPADMPKNDQQTPSTGTGQQTSENQTTDTESGEKTTQPFTFETAKVNVRGREFTGADLVKAYENSTNEGLRLYKTNKQLQEKLSEMESKYLELQAKLDETPPFKILTEEEISELPVPKQVEYYTQKQKWESDKANRKEQLAKLKMKEEEAQKATESYVIARSQHMAENPDKWPDYGNLIPVMEQIIEVAPFLTGYRETPDILYYTALGLKAYREQTGKKMLEAKAKEEAAAKAKAEASVIGTGGTPSPKEMPVSEQEDTDEAFTKRILQKAQKPLFN